MAASSPEWNDFEMARDMWEKSIIQLQAAITNERESRWKLNEAARKLESKKQS
jgi:hypothetical protein